MSRLVTHCIVVDEPPLLNQIMKEYNYTHYICITWLSKCCEEKKKIELLPHDMYRLSIL